MTRLRIFLLSVSRLGWRDAWELATLLARRS